jgi:hypothetical protein
MRTQMTTVVAVLMLCAPGNARAQATASDLAGMWEADTYTLPLSTDFDVSVWGKGATSVRDVTLSIERSGEAALTVTRKVMDGQGKTVAASVSVEDARFRIGAPGEPNGIRTDYAVTVESAERRYPDDPGYRWPIDGLRVRLTTLDREDGRSLEVRFDTPEGRGSFWAELHRQS